MAAGHIEEIQFPEWLSNVVLVPKPRGKWRMCIDFRDLNKACPKDFYPLPRIDQLVNSTSGCELLSMIDASQGYHQIMLALEDWKKRGIEANPLKIKAIIDIKAPTCLNEAQRLTGRIAALSRFISKSAEKSLPFFKTLRKAKTFEWGTPCQLAFEELKAYLARLPLLVKPSPGKTMYLYLSVAPQAISSVLIREEDGKQLPIYYVSKVLNGAEGRYTPIEKMALALVVTARRLRPYFFSSCWSQDQYSTKADVGTTIKAQALADFVSEMTEMTIKDASQDQKWLLHVDGSSTAQGSGAGIVITTPQDSQLVVKQVEGTYEAKEENMIQYLQQIADLKTKFHHFQIIQIPREEKAKANSLSKLASSLEDCRTRHITIHYLPEARPPCVQPITWGRLENSYHQMDRRRIAP
ncbi:UNVERIFIED_CONTAM: hypothetical protein Slati_4483800 [Sesamum latifolium]|uniref:Reverse transcriptase/retrotransposon-derived protein RNase H-like domain-containing protein n=1 Tax=Sesamum latifolium TaxID=2727402 RepID=A0AAW2SUF5_9LAMI